MLPDRAPRTGRRARSPLAAARPTTPAGRRARPWVTAVVAMLGAALVGAPLLLLGAAPAAAATDTTTDTATDTDPVVLVGVTGLRWDDVGTLVTPALWGMSREGAVGSAVSRSTGPWSCPANGWLAVSAGNRAADLRVEGGTCRTLRDPLLGGAVPGWADYQRAADDSSYDPRLGTLGDTLAAAGTAVTGIGPGAAIALAAADGTPVGEHVRLPASTTQLTRAVGAALATSDLVVVDAGTVRDPGQTTADRTAADTPLEGEPDQGGLLGQEPGTDLSGPGVVTEATRDQQVQAIDARVRAVLDAVQAVRGDVTVLVVSLADSGREPHLQLAVATGPVIGGPGSYDGTLLESRSTRQPGYLQATDVTPTLLTALGLRDRAPSGVLVGSPVVTVDGPDLASARVAQLMDDNRHAQATRPLIGPFYLIFVGTNLLLYALVTIGLNARVLAWWRRLVGRRLPHRRPREPERAPHPPHPARVLRGLRLAAVVVSAVPVSTFLANLVPWWRSGSPTWALTGITLGWAGVVSALALAPRWRTWLLGPLGAVAGVTAVVIAADIATGGNLQLNALMGPQALVAGRFYGFSNTAFALFATATVLVTFAITNPLVARGRRRLAATVAAGIGVLATALDGLPSVGADFGGPPALVAGFAVIALLAAGVRLTWWRSLGVLVAGALTVSAFAVLDWLRPADSRTHLGRFVETVLDGGMWPVVERKLDQNLKNLFGSELTLLAVGGLLLVVLLLGRPVRTAVGAPDGGDYGWLSSGAPLRRLGTDAPMLIPGLVGLAVTLGIGFVMNDSGIVVPATGISLAVPLLVVACANWMLLQHPPAAVRSRRALQPAAPPAAPSAAAQG
ncbi:hypothetical protein AGMMS50218_05950 [Actinomycetota bacterium]|nr:hypothetical protein AGMMS50218_05950 [Actinomycetota bacterium]